MKKKFIAVMMMAVIVLSGCGDGTTVSNRTGNGIKTVDDVLQEGLNGGSEDTPTPVVASSVDTQGNNPDHNTTVAADGSDFIDLTSMSSTLIYSVVLDIMTYPDKYIGTKIKMNGDYVYYKDDVTNQEYHSCIIRDATACCQQGIEFIPTNPEKLPADGSDITVEGIFDTYLEGDTYYCTLREGTIL